MEHGYGHGYEETNTTYDEVVQDKITGFLRDEISAACMYMEAAQNIKCLPIASEITKHAQEEFDHFKQIVEFAMNHGISVDYYFDKDVIKDVPTEADDIIELVQELEKDAIRAYKDMALLARSNDDLESEKFFTQLMEAEMCHFDEIAQKTGETRMLGESYSSIMKYMKSRKG